MLMSAQHQPFSRKGWIFEPKLDGMRGIAIVDNDACEIYSRNGLEFAFKYPALAADLGARGGNFVVDGEIVCLNSAGTPDFELLQQRIRMRNLHEIMHAEQTNPVRFYLFDVLCFDGRDRMHLPLRERKQLLAEHFAESDHVRVTSYFQDYGETLFAACRQNGLEGMVGKNGDSIYQAGVRSKHWIKVKILQTTDVVIGGHKPDVGFLVGRRCPQRGLVYVGSVISGLRNAEYDYLRDHLRERPNSPFAPGIERWRATWFEPEIVAEVRFMLWTSGGFLRMPAFTRLRLDRSAHDVC